MIRLLHPSPPISYPFSPPSLFRVINLLVNTKVSLLVSNHAELAKTDALVTSSFPKLREKNIKM